MFNASRGPSTYHASSLEELLQHPEIPEDHIIKASEDGFIATASPKTNRILSITGMRGGFFSRSQQEAQERSFDAVKSFFSEKLGVGASEAFNQRHQIKDMSLREIKEFSHSYDAQLKQDNRQKEEEMQSGFEAAFHSRGAILLHTPQAVKNHFDAASPHQYGPLETIIETAGPNRLLSEMGYNTSPDSAGTDAIIPAACVVSLGRKEREFLTEGMLVGDRSYLLRDGLNSRANAIVALGKTEKNIISLSEKLSQVQEIERRIHVARDQLKALLDPTAFPLLKEKQEAFDNARNALDSLLPKEGLDREQLIDRQQVQETFQKAAADLMVVQSLLSSSKEDLEAQERVKIDLENALQELAAISEGATSGTIEKQFKEEAYKLTLQQKAYVELQAGVESGENWSALQLRLLEKKNALFVNLCNRIDDRKSLLIRLQGESPHNPEKIQLVEEQLDHAIHELQAIENELESKEESHPAQLLHYVEVKLAEYKLRGELNQKRLRYQEMIYDINNGKKHLALLLEQRPPKESLIVSLMKKLESAEDKLQLVEAECKNLEKVYALTDYSKLSYVTASRIDWDRFSLFINGQKMNISTGDIAEDRVARFQGAIHELMGREPSEEELYQIIHLCTNENRPSGFAAGTDPKLGMGFGTSMGIGLDVVKIKISHDKKVIDFIYETGAHYLKDIRVPRDTGESIKYDLNHLASGENIDRDKNQEIPQFQTSTKTTYRYFLPEQSDAVNIGHLPHIELINSFQGYWPVEISPLAPALSRSVSPTERSSEGSTTTAASTDSSALEESPSEDA